MMTIALAVSLVAALLSLVAPRRLVEATALAASVIEFGATIVLTGSVLGTGTVIELGGWLAADALSAVVALITTGIGLLAAACSIGYLRYDMRGRDIDRGEGLSDLRRYYTLFHLFVFAMLVVPLSANLGVLWVAIEGATLASLFLVSFYRTREALEAAWKYVIVGSVGIALALFGTILVYAAAVPVLGQSIDLTWTALAAVAPRLNAGLMQLAFLFVLVGYGTKAGLAPMHTWLPDAHSEAPSPVSALLSGVLLNSGMYGILRVFSLSTASVGTPRLDALLLGFGLLSILVATAFILRQTDYKRLLAYSSVEQLGIVTVAVAFGGPLGAYAALLQLVGHALAKSTMFLASGNVLLRYETREIDQVTGVARALPLTGVFLLVGGLALAGAPPFALFVSEISVLAAGLQVGSVAIAIVALVVLACLGVVFVAFMGHLNRMAFGRPPRGVVLGERAGLGTYALAAGGIALLVLGVTIPAPLHDLLAAAALTLQGGVR